MPWRLLWSVPSQTDDMSDKKLLRSSFSWIVCCVAGSVVSELWATKTQCWNAVSQNNKDHGCTTLKAWRCEMWHILHIGVKHSVRFMNSVYVTYHPKKKLSFPPCPSYPLSAPLSLSKWSWKLWILYLILKFFEKYLLYSLIGTYWETMDKQIKSEKQISVIFLETCMQTFGGLWLY